jgi:NAD(P)-dependent dehydrogenase (short-subunit alcohol dehydrogenase family)
MSHPFELTKDGYDVQWQSNYLAPFMLTTGLLPLLLKSAEMTKTKERVRVVNVSSDMAFLFGPKEVQLQDPNMSNAKGITMNA